MLLIAILVSLELSLDGCLSFINRSSVFDFTVVNGSNGFARYCLVVVIVSCLLFDDLLHNLGLQILLTHFGDLFLRKSLSDACNDGLHLVVW